jgi:hypothetical protein
MSRRLFRPRTRAGYGTIPVRKIVWSSTFRGECSGRLLRLAFMQPPADEVELFFVQVLLRPIAGLTWRTDFHIIRLTEDNDLWYFGGGATRELRNPGFGFGGRPSGGHNSLMEVLETQLSFNWNDWVTTTAYYGHGFGEDVVGADFTNKHANYGFLELTLKFPPM